jgi:hypothetical protein
MVRTPDGERFFQETHLPVLKTLGKCSRMTGKSRSHRSGQTYGIILMDLGVKSGQIVVLRP